MQKIIACSAVSAQNTVNELLAEGFKIIPETLRVVPGIAVPIPEKDRVKGGPVHRSITMFFGVFDKTD